MPKTDENGRDCYLEGVDRVPRPSVRHPSYTKADSDVTTSRTMRGNAFDHGCCHLAQEAEAPEFL